MTDLDRILSSMIEQKVAPLKKEIEELRSAIMSLGDKEYLSQTEVGERYSIGRTTLWKLHRDNKIGKYMINGKRLYKRSELEHIINSY